MSPIPLLLSMLFAMDLLFGPSARANSLALVFSGGGTPARNMASSYFETKALVSHLRGRSALSFTADVRFGIGNRERQSQVWPDVRRLVTGSPGRYVDVLYGDIEGNGPATRPKVERYFLNLGLRRFKNFYLFTNGLGLPNRGDPAFPNPCLELWRYDPVRGERDEWRDI